MLVLVALILVGAAPTTEKAPDRDARARASLAAQVEEILKSPALDDAQVGAIIERLDDQVTLYERNADEMLIPASNVKILTSAAALYYLGVDRRFKTEVYADVNERGVISGDLVIKGYGDPWLVPERLWYLASRIHYLGVRTIKGKIVVDASYFDGPALANGWEQDRSSYSYMAPAGALSVGFNALLVHILPGSQVDKPARVFVDPTSDYAKIEGSVNTSSRGRSRIDVDIQPYRNRSIVQVSGRISLKDKGRAYWRRVDNPPIFAGEVLKTMLKQVGISVKGRVVEGLVPTDAERLLIVGSPRLAELINRINKHSNNFMASQIARILGAEVYEPPGTWEKGRKAIETFLEEQVGIARGSYVLGNASGLHDVNRLSPRQVVMVLKHVYKQPRLRPEFVSSLAVAGGAGTLSERMLDSEAESLLRAKTGTLSSASALSGFVTCASGHTLAFSIIVNDYKVSIQDVWRAQDDLGTALAAFDFTAAPSESSALTSAPQAMEEDTR